MRDHPAPYPPLSFSRNDRSFSTSAFDDLDGNYQLPIANYQLQMLRRLLTHVPLILCLFLLCTGRLTAAPNSKDASPPRVFIIGLSPYLDKSVKDDVYRAMVRLLIQDLPLNSTLTIYDAFELNTIAQI